MKRKLLRKHRDAFVCEMQKNFFGSFRLTDFPVAFSRSVENTTLDFEIVLLEYCDDSVLLGVTVDDAPFFPCLRFILGKTIFLRKLQSGLDITQQATWTSPMNDWLTNLEKFSLGLNPFSADSDNDGISDYEEIKQPGANPLAADFDRTVDTLLTINGGDYTSAVGNWQTEDNTVHVADTLTPTYDDDGNTLTDGSGKVFVWDAENRLTQVTLPTTEIVRYYYDAQSRRVKREHITPTKTTTTTYLYDGWNVIHEPTTTTETQDNTTSYIHSVRSYTWGLDLSDMLQGVGGVGGLLTTKHIPDTTLPTQVQQYHHTYDANGNTSELFNTTGTITAHYEYDAFGKETTATGAQATTNTYRFSTKPLDQTTLLNYYGYRFYQSENGRWINRDPQMESGGENLFEFSQNDSLDLIDYLGLETPDGLLTKALNGSFSITIFKVPLGPGFLVLDVTGYGKVFKCCNLNKQEETWGEGGITLSLYYQIGVSSAPPKSSVPRVPGRDRNKRVQHPCKKGETVKLKYYHLALAECEKRKRGGGEKDGSMTQTWWSLGNKCPTAEVKEFSGNIFVRGTAGVGFGVEVSVTYELNLSSLLSWDNLEAEFSTGWVGVGASVDVGGSGTGRIFKKL
jgi:RHS repeat-associated protein